MKPPNKLIQEESLYLQQHAYNPVDWHPWNTEILQVAKQSQQLLIISIGYAACHWCHVMEKECFQDTEVAQLMNQNFINIKIDREEHPDIDMTYMNALQLMQQHGGWPLNIVALADGTPIWGSTYLPKDKWMAALTQLVHIQQKQPDVLLEFKQNITKSLELFNQVNSSETTEVSNKAIETSVLKWQERWDFENGGMSGAPKFMMPVQLDFLLSYAKTNDCKTTNSFLKTTLNTLNKAGIFDAVGSGFFRYSVDDKWHIPHFEKMLYDNAQLLNSYSNAALQYSDNNLITTAESIIKFSEETLRATNGLYYSSIDADSLEGNQKKEGAFYCWKIEELQNLLEDKFPLFAAVFNIQKSFEWEERYHLHQTNSTASIAKTLGLPHSEATKHIETCLEILHKERNKRNKPSIDTKIITSWNAMMIKGLVTTYYASRKEQYLTMAIHAAHVIEQQLTTASGHLLHSLNKRKKIEGYLEDYAHVISAYIKLFEATGDEKWLYNAKFLTDLTIDEFYDDTTGLFFFTHKKATVVVSKNIEKLDNVIPASNSIMAENLYLLSCYFHHTTYATIASKMLACMATDTLTYPSSHSKWLQQMLIQTQETKMIVISGETAKTTLLDMQQLRQPNYIFALVNKVSEIPLLQNRFSDKPLEIFICNEHSCSLPYHSVESAVEALTENT